MRKKHVYITGATGYIGRHLRKMMADNFIISGIDINPDDKITKGDILQKNHLCNYYHERTNFVYDAVIHLAAKVNVGESVHEPIHYYNTNINGTLNVLRHISTKNFIFASTGAAENPISPYALSKRCAEDCVKKYCEENNIPYTTFRFYNVIGSDGIPPTNIDGLFHNLMMAQSTGKFKLYGDDYNTPDGSAVRDYVHVNEICEAIIEAINKPSNNLENLGHGVGYTVKEMLRIYCEVNNCKIETVVMPRRSGDLERSVLENVSPYMKNLYTIQDYLKRV